MNKSQLYTNNICQARKFPFNSQLVSKYVIADLQIFQSRITDCSGAMFQLANYKPKPQKTTLLGTFCPGNERGHSFLIQEVFLLNFITMKLCQSIDDSYLFNQLFSQLPYNKSSLIFLQHASFQLNYITDQPVSWYLFTSTQLASYQFHGISQKIL